MEHLRLLFDPPAGGAWNMAVDEALLHSAAERKLATLRFYQWEAPTLSLGYFQPAAERALHAASRQCPLVRRASGGGAILHDCELTYSLALPLVGGGGAANALYEQAHVTLIDALAGWGVTASLFRDSDACASSSKAPLAEPFLCFQRRSCFDIVCAGGKIVGSAQRRRRGAVLQHGSVLLHRSQCCPELPGIRELAGTVIEAGDLAAAWQLGISKSLSRTTHAGGLEAHEQIFARSLADERFSALEHTFRR